MVKVAYVIGDYPGEERDRRAEVALSYATSEIEVGIFHAPVTPYLHGLTATEITLVAPAVIEAFHEAQKQGYDAVVPLGFLDLGVEGGRSAVDIPVIGPCEAALHIASLLGDRFGLIAYHEVQYNNVMTLVRRYGMESKVAAFSGSGFDLPDILANRDAMAKNFVAIAKEMIAVNRVEVIIPTGITQCPIHMDPKWLSEELGVPVVEGIGAPIRLAGMLASLGLTHSRKRWLKSPIYAAKE